MKAVFRFASLARGHRFQLLSQIFPIEHAEALCFEQRGMFEQPNIGIVLDTRRFRYYYGLCLGHSLLTTLVFSYITESTFRDEPVATRAVVWERSP